MAILFYSKGTLGNGNISIRNSTFNYFSLMEVLQIKICHAHKIILHLRFSTFFGNQDDYVSTNERKVQPLVFIIRAEKCI